MNRTLQGFDAISGKFGRAYCKINGNNEDMFFAKAVEATAEIMKGTVKTIGKIMVGHKPNGMEITGSMTLYYFTPMFRQMLADYKKTGVMPFFDMVIENDDPASAAGKQVMMLKGICLDELLLAQLDGDSDDPLEEELAFTAEDWEPLQHFNKV